jgi:hypothetical protein
MRARFNRKSLLMAFIVGATSLMNPPASHAVTVNATGTNPAICNQEVNSSSGVTSERLANGDCLVQFKSTSSTYSWSVPSGLTSVRILVVGGGGGGGAAKDNGSGGGGGAGQVKELFSQRIAPKGTLSISVGNGGIAGAAASSYPTENHAGAGGSTEISNGGTSLAVALGGNPGGGSRIATPGAANSIPSGGIGGTAATSSVASQGGSRGSYLGGGGGGGGSSGNGGTGAAGSSGAGGTGGAGTTSVILDSSQTTTTTFGTGGVGGVPSTSLTGTAGTTNTGNGGKGAGAGPGVGADGGAGGSGIVIIRYSTTAPTVNSFALSGNPTVATFRAATTININVNVASRVTFLVNGKRIGVCVSLAATRSSSSYSTSCPWKPTTKGAMLLTAQIDPTSPGLAGFASNLPISVVTRSTSR